MGGGLSERLNKCPECGATQWGEDIVEEHNPDTLDMNMDVTLRCECGHEWEDKVTSHAHQRARERGEAI